eukprot:scaffold360_cov107-Cylindrotheca_fusiformis.AAC.5
MLDVGGRQMFTMITALQKLFEEKYIVDDREPLLIFKLPFSNDDDWALFAPKAGIWFQMLASAVFQSVIQCIFAVLVYKFIVQRRKTMGSYLLGWGFVIPMSCYLPFYLLELLDSRSRPLNLTFSVLMTCVSFRCIEAMFDTSPPVVESSLLNYMAYYSSPVPFVWDEKANGRKRASLAKVASFASEIFVSFIIVSMLLSFLMHFDFRPFGEDSVPFESFHWTWDLFSLRHFGNAYFHSLLIYFTLSVGFNLSALAEMIKGYDVRRIFDSPFLLSRSPTEFWTERWNIMIQQILKVSRLQFFYDGNAVEPVPSSTPNPAARPLGKLCLFQWMKHNLPRPVIAHALIFLHLPFAVWYYGDWIAGGYFDNFSIYLWSIQRVEA